MRKIFIFIRLNRKVDSKSAKKLKNSVCNMLENIKLVLRTLKRFPGDSKEKPSVGSKPDVSSELKKPQVQPKRVSNQEQTQPNKNIKQLNDSNPRNLKGNVQSEQKQNNSRPSTGRNPHKK
jgi:hypothetical protein